MRAFSARFAGICHICNQKFERGASITWSRTQKGHYAHVDCYQKNPQPMQVEENTPSDATPVVKTFDIEPKPKRDSDALLDMLAEALVQRFPVLQETPGVDLANVEKLVSEAVAKATLPLQIELVTETKEVKQVKGAQHKRFPELLYYIRRGDFPYLYGPTQSGKSTAVENAAVALELPYYYLSLNPQTPDSRLMGYMDANGKEIMTVFRRAYEFGGVICLDEVDNASGALLTTLNSALANSFASFPGGMIPRHKDFVCAATGNTPGRGGTPDYPERRSLDGAFAQRFRYIEWPYDEGLEKVLTEQRNAAGARVILSFVRNVRETAKVKGWRLHATPTVSMKLAEYMKDKVLTLDAALDALLFKGIDENTKALVNQSAAYAPLRQAWTSANV